MEDSKKLFSQILKELDEKELRGFINKHCKNDKTMRNKFLTHFANKIKVKPQEKYRVIIDNAIVACTNSRGYFLINDKKVNSALRPLFKLIKDEKVSLHQRPYDAFVLAKLILEKFGEMYEDFYEVGKYEKIGDLFYEALVLIDDICEAETTPYEFKEEIFKDIIELAQNPNFHKDLYCEVAVDLSLLKIAAELCEGEQCRELIKILDKLIETKDEYVKDDYLKLKIELLVQEDDKEGFSKAIQENMDREDIRNMVIKSALENGELEKAIGLIKEGIELFKEDKPGISARYEKLLLDLYKTSGMKKEYLELLNKLYREDYSEEFYDLLKKSYSSKAWKKELAKIINELKSKYSKDSFYLNRKLAYIYKKERMEDELFEVIKENPYFEFLETYGEYCKKSYSKEILNFYGLFVNRQLSRIDTRKEYANLAKTLLKISKIYDGGEEFVGSIYRNIKQIYARKPALLEEMSILSHLDKEQPKKVEVKKEIEKKSLF